jgi:GT2 family glycosyltransferase
LSGPYRIFRQQAHKLRSQLQSAHAAPSREELPTILDHLENLVLRLEEERIEGIQWRKKLEHNQRVMDMHVTAIEESLIFRLLRRLGAWLLAWKAKAGHALLHSPFHGLYLKLRPPGKDATYALWVDQEVASTPTAEWYRCRVNEFSYRPVFSVLLPVHAPPRKWLEEAVQSVLNQTYPYWELCVCDDASECWVREYFHRIMQDEAKIRFVHSTKHLGISGTLNQARSLATGDYFAFLDQDDVLSPNALHHTAESLQEGPAALLYTDEDFIDEEGCRTQPLFKPDWSPDLLLSCMYLGHLLVVSRKSMEVAGELRPGFDGAQDYDLALRVTEGAAVVRHIPQVLYHWRRHAGSTAARTGAKPYTHAAGRRALEDTAQRRNWRVSVEDGPDLNMYNLGWQLQGQPLVSLIICSRSPQLLKGCLAAIRRRTDYLQRQIVVVPHMVGREDAMEKVLLHSEAKRVRSEGPFHFSCMNNLGAEAADGEILVFLNDDVEPLLSSWLYKLAAQAQRPEVGIVGARLLYPAGTLQHAGIAIGIGDGCGHPGRGTNITPYWWWNNLTRNVSAVTGACLAIRKKIFQQLGGFDQSLPVQYNDTDLCLRAHKAGYRVLYEAGAVLRHRECQTRKGRVSFVERERWHARWVTELEQGDPFYSPHLSRMREDASLRFEE